LVVSLVLLIFTTQLKHKAMTLIYTDKDGNNYELQPYPWIKGDRACVGCAFKFGNSNACKEAPTCTPNNNHEGIVKPEWIGKHLVWRIK
jgi:hypothetical protein